MAREEDKEARDGSEEVGEKSVKPKEDPRVRIHPLSAAARQNHSATTRTCCSAMQVVGPQHSPPTLATDLPLVSFVLLDL
eukprot:748525-Hanusia_phi.AAC.2